MTRGSHIVSVGRFGEAVARYLSKMITDLIETQGTFCATSTSWPTATVHIVATCSACLDPCYLYESMSYDQGLPFIPLVMDSRALVLGPVVVPGDNGGGCWSCSVMRSRQHSPLGRYKTIISEYYRSHSDAGPQGYLEPFAMMGAARLSAMIDALAVPSTVAGKIWQIDLLSLRVTEGTAIGIDNCPRCGLHRPQLTRSVTDMRSALHHLWRAV